VAVDTPFAKYVLECLKRHANCDWGELSAEDKRENDLSLDKHFETVIFVSTWRLADMIISEADRSVTTILFPEEY